jgi:hypothetical protein
MLDTSMVHNEIPPMIRQHGCVPFGFCVVRVCAVYFQVFPLWNYVHETGYVVVETDGRSCVLNCSSDELLS